jgi:hypothetical protein
MLQVDPLPFGSIDAVYDLTDNLEHHYGSGLAEYRSGAERSGLLYTCSLGFVDLGHSRETTDFTWYYFNWLRRRGKSKPGDTFALLGDFGGTVTIRHDVPKDDHIRVARSIAYDQALFHEIVSYWIPLPAAHSSSFSPEDLVSNFVGTYVAERAIRALGAGKFAGNFDKAATAELIILLMKVQALPKNKALEAFDQVKGKWVVGNFLDNTDPVRPRYLRRRNFHVAPIVPWLVLKEPACDPLSLPPDFQKQLPPDTRSFYELEFNVDTALHARLGGAVVRTAELDAHITNIKADASQPESAGGYGSDFDKP